MGTLSWSLVEEGSKMKLVAAACLAAVFAEPEAKPDADAALLYGGYGYTGLGYAVLGYAGLGCWSWIFWPRLCWIWISLCWIWIWTLPWQGLLMLMLSPRLMLRLMLLFSMEAMGILV